MTSFTIGHSTRRTSICCTTSKLPVHIFVIITSMFHTRASFHDVLTLTPIFQIISRRNFHFTSFFPCPIPHRTLCYILHYISIFDSRNRVRWYDQSLRWWWWWVFVSLATCTYWESVTCLVHFPDNRELWTPWIRSVVMCGHSRDSDSNSYQLMIQVVQLVTLITVTRVLKTIRPYVSFNSCLRCVSLFGQRRSVMTLTPTLRCHAFFFLQHILHFFNTSHQTSISDS